MSQASPRSHTVGLVAKNLPLDYNQAMNWDMLGHEWAVNLLREHVANGQLRHAYLLTGPQGVGRRTLALRLAQALNCNQPPAPGEPCRACRDCIQIERIQHPDLTVVQAEQEGGTLKVDQVRELQHGLALAPYQARYRVALLLRFEESHPSAANALLKTLEEPPDQVVLILTAGSSESLLPTITSRCEVLRLRPLPLEVLKDGLLTRWRVPVEQATLLASLAGGRPGYALRLFEQPELMAQRQAYLDALSELVGVSRTQRFAYINDLTKDKDKAKENIRQMLLAWLPFWRDVLLRAAGSTVPMANIDRDESIRELATRLGLDSARQAVTAIERTLDLLDKNVNTRLAAEVLMLDLP